MSRGVYNRKGLPMPHSVRARMVAFFAANPDEELSYADAMSKFSVGRKAVDAAVTRMRRAGEIESLHVIRLPTKGRAA